MKNTVTEYAENVLVQFVELLNARNTADTSLRSTVEQALSEGYDVADLVEAGVNAGYSESWVRQLVSQCRVDNGERVRKPGAGRKAPAEASEIVAYAVAKYGKDKARKLLLAAYRAAK